MSTTKEVMDLTVFSRQVMKASEDLRKISETVDQVDRETLAIETSLVSQKLLYLCSRMGLSISNSGTKTEDSQSPTEKHGD